ncbi:MAG TPA: hypothetical protein VGQ99_03260 [Tepidisphaeraceae bacterium]|jgi:antitoxin component of MazEF toxin-antitoxin module|nr:hypothetical protein [Tepidisphaeraceae bacterium]
MITKLTRIGDSWGLVLHPAILELFKIDKETAFEISTEGDRLLIRPVGHQISDDELDAALAHINQKHGTTLQRLAE